MTSGSVLREPSRSAPSMQVRSVLLALALFGAGCRSVSAPAAALVAPTEPPLPQFVLRPVWQSALPDLPANQGVGIGTLGDLDGDGFDELVATDCSSMQRRAALIRGRDGHSTPEGLNVTLRPHHRVDAELSLEIAHGFVNVGDTDGDGRPEIAMIECGFQPYARFPPSGVWLLAMDPWRIVRVWRRDVDSFGAFVLPIGDFDGDGRTDLLTVNDYYPAALEVLSVDREESVWRLELPWDGAHISGVIAMGDIDGGGCTEVMLTLSLRGVPYWMQCLLRGEDGTILWTRSAASPQEVPGPLSLSVAGDVDGDSVVDLWVIGKTDVEWHDLIAIQSGRDGRFLRSCESACTYLYESATCVDLDGDGVRELVLLWSVVPKQHQNLVEIISSRTMAPLFQHSCEEFDSLAVLGTPDGVRLVLGDESRLQAFDLVRVEAGR